MSRIVWIVNYNCSMVSKVTNNQHQIIPKIQESNASAQLPSSFWSGEFVLCNSCRILYQTCLYTLKILLTAAHSQGEDTLAKIPVSEFYELTNNRQLSAVLFARELFKRKMLKYHF